MSGFDHSYWSSDRIEALRKGDLHTQKLFVKETGGCVVGCIRQVLRSKEDIEDCTQETYMRAFDKLDTFRGESSISTWVVAIARNCALMRFRQKQKDHDGDQAELSNPLKYDEFGFLIYPIEAEWSVPVDSLEKVDLQRHVADAIDELPDTYKAITVLRDIEELSTKETSERLGISEGAVKVRLHRARILLRDKLMNTFGEYL